MGRETVFVLELLALGLIFFSLEILSADLITLLLLLGLVASHTLTVDEAFAGLSSTVIIMLASLFVLTGALQRTGVVDELGRRLLRLSAGKPSRLLLAIMGCAGVFGAFMNDTMVTALFLSPVLGLAKKVKVSPSKLLMPLAYASILGGTCTLIGASSNIAVNGFMKNAGLKPIQLFETAPLGLILLGTGIAYVLTVGQRLLPDFPAESLADEYAVREYLSEIVVLKGSKMIGKPISESHLAKLNFHVLEVFRGGNRFLPDHCTFVQPDDVLLVKARITELLKVKETAGIEIMSEANLDDPSRQRDDIKLAEALIQPRSSLIGRTLKEVSFRQRFGVTALALFRSSRPLADQISNIRLRLGDLLLIQGTMQRVELLRHNSDLSILEEFNPVLYRSKKGVIAVLVFVLAVMAGGLGWMPLSMAFLSAAVLTVLLRCIRLDEAYQFIDWRVLILIGGMTAFGVAMEKSGAADFLARWIVEWLRPLGPHGVMAGFILLTILVTQPMSNAAAALVVLPIALNSAGDLHVNPRTFAMAILFSASVSFLTPFEPSCILVYGAGKYRFRDFIKTGLGLTILLALIILVFVPVLWPF